MDYRVFYYGSSLETITPRAITITADDVSRSYGDGNGTLSYSVGGLGLVNGDTLAGKLSTTADSTSGVGGYAIKQGTLEASSNYSVTYSEGTLTVTPRAITVTADDLSRSYGEDNDTLTYTVGGAGLANGDTLTGSLTTTVDNSSNVGSYAIEQGTIAASSNYSVTYNAGTLTITPRAITITADDLDRTYGEDNGELAYTVGGSGLVNGDTLSGALTTTADNSSNVGSYAIEQGTVAASSNYSVTYNAGTLTITPRAITITADDLDRTYGEENGELAYTVGGSGLVNGDTLSGALTTTADNSSNVGSYAIEQGTVAASSNYSVTYNAGTLTITPRAITITADDLSRTYGEDNGALAYTVGGSGLVNGDTLSGALTTTADNSSNVGSYAIEQGTVAASSNYSVTYNAGTLTITPRAITITADDLDRTYGEDNGELAYTVGGSGLVNGDTLTGSLTTTVDNSSNVGSYAIEQGTIAASSNYSVTYNAGTLTITPRAITITADDLDRTYGEDNGELAYTVGGSGLVNGDTLSGALTTTADNSSNVGSYAIEQGTVAASSNYSVTYNAGTLTITPRAITITADDLDRTYGEDNGELAYTVGGAGLVNGDTLSGSLTTTADNSSNVGNYSIQQGTVAASSNYSVTYNAGTLTITPRAITITADDLDRTYGEDNGELAYTVGGSGLVNGDTLSGALTTTADNSSNVGSYAIEQGTVAASSNYSVTYNAGTLTITPRAITITADDLDRTYGEDNGELAYTVGGSGLVNGDTLSGALTTTADNSSNVGNYSIQQGTVAASSNYSVTYNAGTLTITPRAITITADDLDRTYGEDNGELAYTVGGAGLVNGDTLTGSLATAADSSSDVGTYSIYQGTLAASSNYEISAYTAGTLTVVASSDGSGNENNNNSGGSEETIIVEIPPLAGIISHSGSSMTGPSSPQGVVIQLNDNSEREEQGSGPNGSRQSGNNFEADNDQSFGENAVCLISAGCRSN